MGPTKTGKNGETKLPHKEFVWNTHLKSNLGIANGRILKLYLQDEN
jgi:hypothetical protein